MTAPTSSSTAMTGEAATWHLKPVFSARALFLGILAFLLLAYSGHRMQIDDMVGRIAGFALVAIGLQDAPQGTSNEEGVLESMFPLAVSERTPVDRIADFDADALPPFSHLETVSVEESALDPDTLQMTTKTIEKTFLVEPGGYLLLVITKIIETIEIAVWASLFAVIVSLPLAWLSARNYSPHRLTYIGARAGVSFLRAIPELISALFLVLAFGFGPIAGILALALHSAGFLAKFYAEDIEAADRRPQEALRALGAGDFTILRLAVLPQVLPSYAALTLYILDRNVRMATVIGLVGAGGIGQELKGRFDMFQYDRVGTILLVIFVTVLLLDQLAAHVRRKLI
ncbi:phosphonate ABC transporter, permease protein PhnE [Henriciella aquimarina]|uniref:phosphonate ABC transporter, permease protein PhnE n=1 Tax=Henriciella aquimarina TaxID=545261 RepID=UPI001F47ED3E|nr:phosphonate ABC transporter, permease protein PhnE [Henriciella aquimarina]